VFCLLLTTPLRLPRRRHPWSAASDHPIRLRCSALLCYFFLSKLLKITCFHYSPRSFSSTCLPFPILVLVTSLPPVHLHPLPQNIVSSLLTFFANPHQFKLLTTLQTFKPPTQNTQTPKHPNTQTLRLYFTTHSTLFASSQHCALLQILSPSSSTSFSIPAKSANMVSRVLALGLRGFQVCF
jgi:hypothetical protein